MQSDIEVESKKVEAGKVSSLLTGYAAEIHANAREATARQTYRAICKQNRPDIAIALILLAIDDWYVKGIQHGITHNDPQHLEQNNREDKDEN